MVSATKHRFEEIADNWSNDALTTKLSDLPKCVYHYTDAAGLAGMLTSGKIWATDYRFLNDRSEIKHTRSRVRELISEKMKAAVGDPLALSLYGEILERQDKEGEEDLFVFSLSEKRDDLSQWRGYARNGQGFTIGFCAATIYKVSSPEDAPFGFSKIVYNHDKQTQVLESSLGEIEDELRRVAAEDGADMEELAIHAAHWFSWMVGSTAASNKHSSFESEQEWRILAFAKPGATSPKVRVSGLNLVRFTEHAPQGATNPKLPIKEIGIGPGFVGSEDVHAIRDICRATGYDPIIYTAETPFRRTQI